MFERAKWNTVQHEGEGMYAGNVNSRVDYEKGEAECEKPQDQVENILAEGIPPKRNDKADVENDEISV